MWLKWIFCTESHCFIHIHYAVLVNRGDIFRKAICKYLLNFNIWESPISFLCVVFFAICVRFPVILSLFLENLYYFLLKWACMTLKHVSLSCFPVCDNYWCKLITKLIGRIIHVYFHQCYVVDIVREVYNTGTIIVINTLIL